MLYSSRSCRLIKIVFDSTEYCIKKLEFMPFLLFEFSILLQSGKTLMITHLSTRFALCCNNGIYSIIYGINITLIFHRLCKTRWTYNLNKFFVTSWLKQEAFTIIKQLNPMISKYEFVDYRLYDCVYCCTDG